MGDGWIALLIVAISIVVAILAWYAAERRRKALAEFAQANGFEFRGHPGDHHDQYESFTPFGRGNNRRSSNLISGQRDGVQWEMFDYRFTTGSGKNKSTHHAGIVLARVPLYLPKMGIRPEGIFDKLASVVGFDDIDFESAEFSRKFHVNCADRKTAYDLIHPQMIEYLLSQPAQDWQISGPVILLHRSRHYEPGEMSAAMSLIAGFVERIPEYVREDLGARRNQSA